MASRRTFIKNTALAAVATNLSARLDAADRRMDSFSKKKIRHSVCRWCYQDMPIEDLCRVGKEIGLEAIDLVGPSEFDTLKKMGMHGSMVSPEGLKDYLRVGWNNPDNHANLVEFYQRLIPQAAASGFTNVICFSGNRNGIDDDRGLQMCAEGLGKIIQLAEREGVTLMMELLNSKVDHHDYQCDRTAWGVKLCQLLGSNNFRLLYDIYHMQIMEGDVIRTIREQGQYLGHFHTAGVPGRHEIDDSQELNYPAIMRAIAESDFSYFVAQEFIPVKEDKIASLREAVKICTV